MSATDKMKNAAQSAKGSARVTAGKATGDRHMQAQGQTDKAAASLKQAGEKVKDAFK
jgi:uncharacterized protein YjbJ (UPF0337 family)